MSDRRLLLVHAHPDDESSQSAVTMSRYVAEGAQVTLVTCNLGERGEILVPEWSHFSPHELGQHRLGELATALGIMGVTDHVWLGGPGRYSDSGMDRDEAGKVVPAADMAPNAFWNADLLEAANFLVEVIRDRRPQVVSTYDPFGGYGHPDHMQAHRVTMYAVALAAAPSHRPDLGEPWQVSRVLWSTHDMRNWSKAFKIARERGLAFEGWDEDAEPGQFGPDPKFIEAVIGYGEYGDIAKRALMAHRSQVKADDDFWQMIAIARELPGAGEAYMYAGGVPFPASSSGGPADDLFAGLD